MHAAKGSPSPPNPESLHFSTCNHAHAAEGAGKLQVYGKSPVPPESIDFVDCLTKCAAQ